MCRFGWVLLVLAATAACGAPSVPPATPPPPAFPGGPLVDLSHAYDAQAIFWPTAAPFTLAKVHDGMTQGGYYYAANDFATSEHGGTHVDAPIHFAQGHQTVDQIPLERLVGAAVVIDVTEAAARDADYQVTVDDLERAEARDGRIPDRAIVLIRTGFSRRWPDAATYLGTAERGAAAVAKLHFPGLHPDAARVADRPPIDRGDRDRHGEHRLRPVDGVRVAPGALRQGYPGLRELHQPRSPADAGRLHRRAADEDRRRQRRAAARHCHPAIGTLDQGVGSGVYVR